MKQDLPQELVNENNRGILAYLEGKSAHSDLGVELRAAVTPLGNVQLFCPDWQQCRYVVASTKGVIFSCAFGMNAIAFRLDERLKSRALLTGGAAAPECGPDWVSFPLFRDDWPKIDGPFWALKAYVYARETAR